MTHETINPASVYAQTLDNGGGTFVLHAANFTRQTVTSGYAVGIVVGSWRIVGLADRNAFNQAIHDAVAEYPNAQAIGTWVNGDVIHIDPVRIFDNEGSAARSAVANLQLAYFCLSHLEEVTTGACCTACRTIREDKAATTRRVTYGWSFED